MKAFVKKFKENFDYWFMYRTPINIKNYWLSVKFSFAGQELVFKNGKKKIFLNCGGQISNRDYVILNYLAGWCGDLVIERYNLKDLISYKSIDLNFSQKFIIACKILFYFIIHIIPICIFTSLYVLLDIIKNDFNKEIKFLDNVLKILMELHGKIYLSICKVVI